MRKQAHRWSHALAAMLLLAGWFVGCKSFDRPRGPQRANPRAEYSGLAQQRTAVLVTADDPVLFNHPNAPELVARSVSARLAQTVPGIVLMSPTQLSEFQKRNPYWMTLLPDDLTQKLNVQRLVMIDLTHFSTHEPGDAHLWQGLITGEISVFENPPTLSNTPVYRTTVTAAYPDRPSIGLINSDEPTILLATLNYFARSTAWLFYDAPRDGDKDQ